MKACWMVCLVTALGATSAWAESPLQSLQFEQQKTAGAQSGEGKMRASKPPQR